MRKKAILAAVVLTVGLALALVFRKSSSQPSPAADGLSFREPVERRLPEPRQAATAKGQAAGRQAFRVPTAAATASAEADSPAPEMSASYQRTFSSLFNPLPDADAETAGQPDEPARTPRQPVEEMSAQTHKIVDGDTLRKLAERYLGNSDRYLEIYEANRGVLSSPDLLPIGATLEIPPKSGGQAASSSDKEHGLRLVPVPKGAQQGSTN